MSTTIDLNEVRDFLTHQGCFDIQMKSNEISCSTPVGDDYRIKLNKDDQTLTEYIDGDEEGVYSSLQDLVDEWLMGTDDQNVF